MNYLICIVISLLILRTIHLGMLIHGQGVEFQHREKLKTWFLIILTNLLVISASSFFITLIKIFFIYFAYRVDEAVINNIFKRQHAALSPEQKLQLIKGQAAQRKCWQVCLLMGVLGYLILESNIHHLDVYPHVLKMYNDQLHLLNTLIDIARWSGIILVDVGLFGGLIFSKFLTKHAPDKLYVSSEEVFLRETFSFIIIPVGITYQIFIGYTQAVIQHHAVYIAMCIFMILSCFIHLLKKMTLQNLIQILILFNCAIGFALTWYHLLAYISIYQFMKLCESEATGNVAEFNLCDLESLWFSKKYKAIVIMLLLLSMTSCPFSIGFFIEAVNLFYVFEVNYHLNEDVYSGQSKIINTIFYIPFITILITTMLLWMKTVRFFMILRRGYKTRVYEEDQVLILNGIRILAIHVIAFFVIIYLSIPRVDG